MKRQVLKRAVAIGLAAALLLSGTACSKRDANGTAAASGTGSAAAQSKATATLPTEKKIDPAKVEGKANNKDLVVAAGTDTPTLDPHCAGISSATQVLLPVVETLVRYDADGKLVPWLAESWELLDDHSWKFHLRKGVKFHNGEEMKASDVVFSFKRATTDYAANVAYIMDMIDPDKLEAVDDYTVIVRTKVPFAAFISYMPYIGASILSEKAYKSEAAKTHPVGTGPYEFVEYKKGAYVKYKKFANYWKGEPGCDTLTIKCIPELSSRYTALETGEVDIAVAMTVNEVNKLMANDKLNISTSPTTVFSQLLFNCQKAPFDNKKFRQGLDYAINEEEIVQALSRGTTQYTPGPVTPKMKYFDDSDTHCRYDLEKAKQLLKESGADLNKTYEIATSDSKTGIDQATILQQQLVKAGVKVKIRPMESSAYFEYMQGTEKEMFLSGWGAVGFPDPDNNLYGPLHSAGIPSNNSCMYKDAQLDKMLDKQRALADGPEREKLVKEIQKYIRDAVPYLTLDNPLNLVGVRDYVQGFRAMAPSEQYFNDVSLIGKK